MTISYHVRQLDVFNRILYDTLVKSLSCQPLLTWAAFEITSHQPQKVLFTQDSSFPARQFDIITTRAIKRETASLQHHRYIWLFVFYRQTGIAPICVAIFHANVRNLFVGTLYFDPLEFRAFSRFADDCNCSSFCGISGRLVDVASSWQL